MALEATDKNLDNKEFLRMYRALPETARSLVEVPVYPADLARNHCLNVPTALADRISAAGDDRLELLESAGFWVDSGLSLPARAGYDVRADVMR